MNTTFSTNREYEIENAFAGFRITICQDARPAT